VVRSASDVNELRSRVLLVKAKFHYVSLFKAGSKLVTERFEAGLRLVADLQRVEIWLII